MEKHETPSRYFIFWFKMQKGFINVIVFSKRLLNRLMKSELLNTGSDYLL